MAELETVRQFKTPEPTPSLKISFTPHGEVYSFVVGATTIEFPEAFWGSISGPIKFKAEAVLVGRTAVSYRWDFGDGHTGSGAEPSHTYSQASENISVICVMTDNFGVEWTARKSMYLKNEFLLERTPTETLKVSALPATFIKLPWSETTASFSTSNGWMPSSWINYPKGGSHSGLQYIVKNVGNSMVSLRRNTGTILSAERQYAVWLHSANTGEPSGYQAKAEETASNTFTITLTKWVSGTGSVLGTYTGRKIEPLGLLALVAKNGKVIAYTSENEATPATVAGEVTESTFTEGYAGIDGNGSNFTYINFTTGSF